MSSPASQATTSPQPVSPQPYNLRFSLDAFEKVAKALVLFVALLYALGMIVSMQHLMSLGISDFSALRPRYIATGFWTLLLFFMASFPVLLPTLSWAKTPPKWNRKSVVLEVLIFAIATFISLSGQYLLLMALSLPPHVIHKAVGLLTLAVSAFTLDCLLVWLWSRRIGPKDWKAYLLMFFLYYIPIVFFVVARVCIQEIYLQVPDALGGGKPMSAELILNKDGIEVWREMGIPLANQSDPTKTARVKILYQSDQELVVSATYQDGKETKQKTVIMKKSLVNGILPMTDDQR